MLSIGSHALYRYDSSLCSPFLSNSYSEELPSRCVKEIIHAANAESKCQTTGNITITGFQKILENIGATHQVSRSDIELIIDELGDNSLSERTIPVHKMLQIL
jgi:hypothetical protein